MAARRKPDVRRRRCALSECEVGDVVYLALYGTLGGRRWVREVDGRTFREISEPRFIALETEVKVVRPAGLQYAKGGGETDPLKRGAV